MSGIDARADFSGIRYAQVWEDADILRRALNVQPGDRCLSIASAGDNALALLLDDPAAVVALDLSRAQLACVALRIAAYRTLEHAEWLELAGARPSDRRAALYTRCRRDPALAGDHGAFWDAHSEFVARGVAGIGRFERYFTLFRTRMLPLVHRRRTVRALLEPRDRAARIAFHDRTWNTWRWRLLFRVFFSRRVMGRLGRDPEFFRYVEGSVADRIRARTTHALTELAPAENPYLHWILCGTHGAALPCAWRPEHYDTIRARVDRIVLRHADLGTVLAEAPARSIHRFNLSDLFEYISERDTAALLAGCAAAGAPGGRLVYWNMLAPRSRPDALADRLRPHPDEADALLRADKAFFYSRLVIEEVLP